MNRLPITKQALIAGHLVEGAGCRQTSRLCGCTLNTVLRNLVWIGEACYEFHDQVVRGLTCSRVEADELWSFVYAKDRVLHELPDEKRAGAGTKWTWVAIDPDSRLVINWHVGDHEASDAQIFMDDLASRIPGRIQLTTDQLMHYLPAVQNAFGDRVDYATIQKKFKRTTLTPDGRYEQPILRGNRRKSHFGEPDPEQITTTSIESQNFVLRQTNRRYSRSTNMFSKRIRNMRASLALNYAYYNFCRIHPAIRITPAMAANLTTWVWEIEELIERVNVDQSRKVPL